MKRILVTGATGNVGRQVVSQLLAIDDVRVRALTRDPASANLAAAVEVMRGDLTVPETLEPCLDGVDAVFLVWTTDPSAISAAVDRSARNRAPHQGFGSRLDLSKAGHVCGERAVLVGSANPCWECSTLAVR